MGKAGGGGGSKSGADSQNEALIASGNLIAIRGIGYHLFKRDEPQLLVPEISNCYDCALTNSGLNYQCNYGNELSYGLDEGNIVCCQPFSTDSYCQNIGRNICSKSYITEGNRWRAYCPQA